MDVRWVSVVVALVGVGVGVWMKIDDGSLKSKKKWGWIGTSFIGTGVTILVVVILGMFGAQFRSPIVFDGDGGSPESPSLSNEAWEAYPLVQVKNKVFRSETIKLDGYMYINCVFDNVTFEFDGKAPTDLIKPRIRTARQGDRIVQMKTNNPAVRQTMVLMKFFNQVSGVAGAVVMPGDSPLQQNSLPVK